MEHRLLWIIFGQALNGESIDEQGFRHIRSAVWDLKRDNPLLTVNELLDEDQFEERADQFIEYHEEIIASDEDE